MRRQLYTLATNSLSKLVKTPPYIILFVSDSCPNNCTHCWYSNEWKKENLIKSELTNDELVLISEKIKSIKFLSITGGEAFLRDGIEEIVKAFAVNSTVSRFDIPTSGFDADLIADKAERILEYIKGAPLRIDVSIDGTEDTHNHIRQNNSAFTNAIKTIEALKLIRKKYSNLDISIITTVSDNNNHEVIEIAELVERLLPDGEWMINIVRGSTPLFDVADETHKAYKFAGELLDKRISGNKFSGDRGHKLGKWLTAKNQLRRRLIDQILTGSRQGGGCAAGCLAGVIFNDGEIRACETLPLSFGNIRDYNYDLNTAWNSPAAENARKLIQDKKCICTHECFLSVSMLIQPSCWLALAKERLQL
jgi:MoaA/NifB/PqqE/SkfB family radical SAM enzyme